MSRQNKANRNNYTQAGRLTPDDIARERQKQGQGRQEQGRSVNREQAVNRAKEGPPLRGGRASTHRRTSSEE